MREIVLDTETTGLDPKTDRIIEIGCVELLNHIATGKTYHTYINPQRAIPPQAVAVHGLTEAFLADKPVFAKIAGELLAFLGDAALVIHNASFDVGFLNAELQLYDSSVKFTESRITCTLQLARRKHPGSPASLDALCQRYKIAGKRGKHSAIEDAELLSRVYVELLGIKQGGFDLSSASPDPGNQTRAQSRAARQRPEPLPPILSPEQEAAHLAWVKEKIGPKALWLQQP